MDFRTTFHIEPSEEKITYNDKVMFIGSCFASNIGCQLESGHMPVMINPTGAVFNPVSVANTLNLISEDKKFSQEDLHYHDDRWLSFYHYTNFSSANPLEVLDKINRKTEEASSFLKDASFLFITFGTARFYTLRNSGLVVSNCHKIPADQFDHGLLSVEEIVSQWNEQLDRFHKMYPQLKIIFTISPVRHWKDGAYGNQVSKSVLFVAVNELLKHSTSPGYFPAYELMIDDLRDYRFYNDDLLHPSSSAISYIWDQFTACYFAPDTKETWNEVIKIKKAFNHRPGTDDGSRLKTFADRLLKQINDLKFKVPAIDLSKEEEYFLKMRNE